MFWRRYRISGRGSHSMRYVGPKPWLDLWLARHPYPWALPVPTFVQWLRFWFGFVLLKDRWVVFEESKFYPQDFVGDRVKVRRHK